MQEKHQTEINKVPPSVNTFESQRTKKKLEFDAAAKTKSLNRTYLAQSKLLTIYAKKNQLEKLFFFIPFKKDAKFTFSSLGFAFNLLRDSRCFHPFSVI